MWQQKARVSTQVTSSTSVNRKEDSSILNLRDRLSVKNSSNIPQRFVHSWDTPIHAASEVNEKIIEQAESESSVIDEIPIETSSGRTRYGRKVKPPEQYDPSESMCAFISTFTPVSKSEEQLLQSSHMHHREAHPFASACQHVFSLITADSDTMTLAKALEEPDKDKFLKAMTKELMDHIQRGHWKVVPLDSIPSHKRAIPMVWAMKRK